MMDDLAQRLRNTPNWMRESYGSWKDCVLTYDRAPFEAADEIERLRAELSTLSAATASVQTDQRAAIDQSRELLRIVTAERDSLRSKIADDSFATTFQTMGQYRTALLRALLPPNVQVSGARAEGNEASGCRDASAPT
jgi:hypothetical protein